MNLKLEWNYNIHVLFISHQYIYKLYTDYRPTKDLFHILHLHLPHLPHMLYITGSINFQLSETMYHRVGSGFRGRHSIRLVPLLLLRLEMLAQRFHLRTESCMHLSDRWQVSAQLFRQALLGNKFGVKLVKVDVRLVCEELNNKRSKIKSRNRIECVGLFTILKISARINGLIIDRIRSKNDTTFTTWIWHSLPGSPSCK